jgi:hypothetical protein
VHEFLPAVLTLPWFSARHSYDFNGTFVLDERGNLCVDPVEPDAATLDRLTKEGVARILITNRNHVRAANAVRERTGARVAIHPADAAYARRKERSSTPSSQQESGWDPSGSSVCPGNPLARSHSTIRNAGS